MAEFIVDVEGFKRSDNQFVLNELVTISLGEDIQPTVYFFEPPYIYNILPVKYRCESEWLKRNLYGLHWDDGKIPYCDVFLRETYALDDHFFFTDILCRYFVPESYAGLYQW